MSIKLGEQIEELAEFIMKNHHDKITEGGAVDVAIDIINSFSDELETLHAAYGNAQKEISDLKNHNDILIKRNRRLERRSG